VLQKILNSVRVWCRWWLSRLSKENPFLNSPAGVVE